MADGSARFLREMFASFEKKQPGRSHKNFADHNGGKPRASPRVENLSADSLTSLLQLHEISGYHDVTGILSL